MQELHVIKEHCIKDYTMMVDDMRCWEEPNPVHGFSKMISIKKLEEINPSYEFEFLDGHQEKDILVAYI